MSSNQNEHQFAEAFYRLEFVGTITWHLVIGIIGFILTHLFAYLFPNEYQLFFNCHILFLSPDAFLFAWELNYFIMTAMSVFVIVFFMCYVPLLIVLMNQTCWLLDMTLMTVEEMNTGIQPDDDVSD